MTTNFKATAGDTTPVYVVVRDQAGEVMDLTGASARWMVSRGTPARFSPQVLLTKSTANGGITITAAPEGEMLIDLQPSDTRNLTGDYYHELELVDGNGAVTTPLSGLMTVTRALVGDTI